MEKLNCQVAIIGAGGCGLSLSIFLSNLGIDTLTFERHPDTAVVPKARYINQRAMEIFRQHGVAEEIYSRSIPSEYISNIRWWTTLGGNGPLDRREFFKMECFGGGSLAPQYKKDSPCESTLYPQVRMEPLLRQEAEKRAPGKLFYNHELVKFSDNPEGVIATIKNRESNEEFQVHANYMIACDGGKTVGPQLGVDMQGPKNLAEMVTVYFKSDLSEYWNDDHAMTTWFVNPEGGSWASGVLGKLGPNNHDRHSEEWMFHFSFRPDDPAKHDEEALIPRMRELLKIPDLDPEIIRVGRWTVEGVLANRYRFGRVFIAGDAAHKHPPTTGLGLNSAIQDAHNLAWKLALVLKGSASHSLLDTYESERRPVAAHNVSWALMTFNNHALTDGAIGLIKDDPIASQSNFEKLFSDDEEGETRRERLKEIMQIQRMEWQAHDLELGYSYSLGAVVPDASLPPKRDPMGSRYIPTTRPGHRLPHVWVTIDGVRKSTHDLVGLQEFLLIIGHEDNGWKNAAEEVSSRLNTHISAITIDEEQCDRYGREWLIQREVSSKGAILVRPDNHVAWRSVGDENNKKEALLNVMLKLLFLPYSRSKGNF